VAPPRLEPFRPTPPERGLPATLRDPVRAVLLLGAIALLVGALLSWLEVFMPGHGWFEMSSFERSNDGGFCLELSIVTIAAAWSDRIATSRQPFLVAAPLFLGVVAVIVMYLGYTDAQAYLDSLKNSGGHGYLLPGFWIAAAGAGLVTLAGAAGVYRARNETRFHVPMSQAGLATMLGGGAGAFIGFGAAIVLGEALDPSASLAGSTVVFLAIVLALVGAWIGTRVGRAFGGGPGEP
jgi:hypothetical protein